MMRLHSDFSQRATVTAVAHCLVDARQPGVERVRLHRLGAHRLPPGDATELHAGAVGTTLDLKTGHRVGLAT